MSDAGYAFLDTGLAARRLVLLASVFEAPSAHFLRRIVTTPPAVAVDLGCGPGLTTRLLAATTGARRTTGIDESERFLELARRDAPEGVEFAHHDATITPLPGAPADLIYCRLLLAHLPDPGAMVARWTTQLRPGGVLAVDEVEEIRSEHALLREYEAMVEALVASRGASVSAGPAVDALTRGPGWRKASSELVGFRVPVAAAARMFGMNLATWRDDPFVRRTYGRATVERVAAGLASLSSSGSDGTVTWVLRHATFVRNG